MTHADTQISQTFEIPLQQKKKQSFLGQKENRLLFLTLFFTVNGTEVKDKS